MSRPRGTTSGWLAVLLLGGLVATAQAEIPVIKVDEAHQAMAQSGRQAVPNLVYEIPAGQGVLLDISKPVRFKSGDVKFNRYKPNRLDLQFADNSKARYYRIYSSSQKMLELDRTTLRREEDAPPFPGFRAGDRFIISLGYEFPRPHRDEKRTVATAWVGVVDVVGAPEKEPAPEVEGIPVDQMGDR
ncbi:MAG: hypothetical protein AAGK14_11000 [Verrucomicrobiota bacterium]